MSRRRVCALEEIPDGTSKGVWSQGESPWESVFLVREGQRVFAYRNVCPHTGVAMNWTPDDFLDLDGRYVICGIHGALFRIQDGLCIHGPCLGESLEALPVGLIDGEVWLLEAPHPAAQSPIRE